VGGLLVGKNVSWETDSAGGVDALLYLREHGGEKAGLGKRVQKRKQARGRKIQTG